MTIKVVVAPFLYQFSHANIVVHTQCLMKPDDGAGEPEWVTTSSHEIGPDSATAFEGVVHKNCRLVIEEVERLS
jgi:hypothetical protein